MSFERSLVESLWRLDAQTRSVAELADEHRSVVTTLGEELGTWPTDHEALATVLHQELTSLATDLSAVEQEATEVDDRQRDAIAESTTLDDDLRLATTELALARDRLLQVAVATESAEEIEGCLTRRIAAIRTLIG